jgi:putative protease
MADVGCRNTIVSAEAQVASRHLDALVASGIRHFRLEFVHETGQDVRRIAAAFRSYFSGEIDAARLDDRLADLCRQGTTQGSLFVPPDYLRVPVLNGAIEGRD